ncbi:phosphate acetyltransferase [Apilactobacillus micheneri]|uniref:Phosphate acetyltransferase n=1 Tax=Apilactobacillus micheneri TaxID=1899430 RepID=A0ABY2YW19_9LACO|nr:phosphate acetyltransferase [Apilactobacillus micheneri]TPR24258.1 phosphate acetyltransferase [Apilactobacillus micheneri]TPR25277.1 phosphate acetyltransferase [Apilactobacillus micheneri]TPR27589.1 phosphate acetyltransferase [Apilactobacillus micheneri]TPR28854.1 phosphate acetyltransferase [Apilactobacillus micheneri]TPR29876.1 phosphate acetyltransferase [Apilactobacillus micheneri]
MSNLFDGLRNDIKGKNKKIVFPEGSDERIIEAASRLASEDLITPILLGNNTDISKHANGADLSKVQIIDINDYPKDEYEAMLDALEERRNGKNTREQLSEWLNNENYFGTMLVYMGKADGMVSGAAHATGDTVRPALQIIKTKKGMRRISGSFLMQKGDTRYVFADCAINLELDAAGMVEVAKQSAETAKMFGIDPKVAFLSFSTKGSAKGEMVTKVQEAAKMAQDELDCPSDGELQFDAALVPEVAKKKAPTSGVAGNANVFVFPELQSGNIGYKIAQRLGGFEAFGPILQGMAKPVSDLSRGCNAEDVYNVSIITAAQSLK